jgi:hypothetical protein
LEINKERKLKPSPPKKMELVGSNVPCSTTYTCTPKSWVEALTTIQATKEVAKQQQRARGVSNWYLKNNGNGVLTTSTKVTSVRNKQQNDKHKCQNMH